MIEQRYPVVRSKIEPASETFIANREANEASVAKLDEALAQSREGGGEKYVQRHLADGKLLPRDRVEKLLDRDSHFLEIAPLAGYKVRGHKPGASIVAGIGVVSGIECMLNASESTVSTGAISELGVTKGGRIADIVEANGLPAINLVESAGADLPNQSKIFVRGGQGFRDITRRSRMRAPTLCLVFGSWTAGGAYIPGMSDYVVMVKEQAKVYLGGPPLVKMAIGEEATHEELGGAEMHSRVSGVSDYLAQDELDAIRIGREIMAHLEWKKAATPAPREVEAPRYDAEEPRRIA